MVRFTLLNSFVTLCLHLTDNIIAHFIIIVLTVGTALFCYIKVEDLASNLITYYFETCASVSFKAAGIVYQSKQWIGSLAELNCSLFDTNNLCFCFFMIILRLLF